MFKSSCLLAVVLVMTHHAALGEPVAENFHEMLTTEKGKSYKAVTVKKVTPEGIRIQHEAGATTLKYSDLAEDIRRQYYEADAEPSPKLARLKALYLQAKKFRHDPKLFSFGFAEASPHRAWYEEITKLMREKDVGEEMLELSIKHGVAATPGDIYLLGDEWRNSKGADTNFSRFVVKELDATFGALPKKK